MLEFVGQDLIQAEVSGVRQDSTRWRPPSSPVHCENLPGIRAGSGCAIWGVPSSRRLAALHDAAAPAFGDMSEIGAARHLHTLLVSDVRAADLRPGTRVREGGQFHVDTGAAPAITRPTATAGRTPGDIARALIQLDEDACDLHPGVPSLDHAQSPIPST